MSIMLFNILKIILKNVVKYVQTFLLKGNMKSSIFVFNLNENKIT